MSEKSKFLTDEEVEREIERLNNSEAVALAKKAMRLKNRRRQRMYQLRDFEKKGKALMEAGITAEMLEAMYKAEDKEDELT